MKRQIILIIMIQFMMSVLAYDCLSYNINYDDLSPKGISCYIYLVNSDLINPAVQKKSPEKAFLLSAIVPGTGEFYGGSKRGLVFISAETAFWISYFILHRRADEINNSYLDAVRKNIRFEEDSPVKSTDTWTLEDFEHATQSDNWHYVYTENNGKPIPRVGKFYWSDAEATKDEPAGELVNNSKLRQQAYKTRMSANKKYKQAKIGLGLVVVNHVVSAIDARILAINRNKRDIKISVHNNILPSGEATISIVLKKLF
ncbi:MAG: hypothetical protein ACUVWN_12310 [bacterium]